MSLGESKPSSLAKVEGAHPPRRLGFGQGIKPARRREVSFSSLDLVKTAAVSRRTRVRTDSSMSHGVGGKMVCKELLGDAPVSSRREFVCH
jgi:hypothetical protein